LIEWETLSYRQGWIHSEDNQVKQYSVILKRKSLLNTQNNYHCVSAEWHNIPRVNQQIFLQMEPVCKSRPWRECIKLSLTTTFCFGMAVPRAALSGWHWRMTCSVSRKSGCTSPGSGSVCPFAMKALSQGHAWEDRAQPLKFWNIFFQQEESVWLQLWTCCFWLRIARVKHAGRRDKKMWQQSEPFAESPAPFSPDLEAALQGDEISSGELRPVNDAHEMGCELIRHSLLPTCRICDSLRQV